MWTQMSLRSWLALRGMDIDVRAAGQRRLRRLSRKDHPDRRSLCARRRHRRDRADAGAGDGERPRRHHHHREQAGGGDHHRHAERGRQRARWLHAADGDIRQCGESEPEFKTALRPAQGFRRGRAGGEVLQHRRGQYGVADQVDCRSDCRGQSPIPTNYLTAPTAPARRRIWRASCSRAWPRSI